jgi:2-oxoisovalerate dehydrogenase E2 component (dihydrolipoyl transacylase)
VRTFRLPDLGEGLHEAEIVRWLVAIGEDVAVDQPLVSVETDKAVVDLPSPCSGRVTRLFGEPGDVLPLGAALVEIDDGAAGPTTEPTAPAAADERSDAATVVGNIARSRDAAMVSGRAAAAAPPAPAGAGGPSTGSETASQPSRAARRPLAVPAVRMLARRLGVDLESVVPTGSNGEITRADVTRAAEGRGPAIPGEKSRRAGDARVRIESTNVVPEGFEPLRGPRRAMAANMSRAHVEVVPATVDGDAGLRLWPAGTDTTMRLVRAVTKACEASPALNAWYDGRARARRLHDAVNLGIAVDSEEGLFVPVLFDTGRRTPENLRAGLDALRADVIARTIQRDSLSGQTITLSNFGMIGGRYAALVIVPPQVAIVGAGRVEDRAVVRDGAVCVERVMPLSVTFDHRAVTGGEAARFLTAMIADLELET